MLIAAHRNATTWRHSGLQSQTHRTETCRRAAGLRNEEKQHRPVCGEVISSHKMCSPLQQSSSRVESMARSYSLSHVADHAWSLYHHSSHPAHVREVTLAAHCPRAVTQPCPCMLSRHPFISFCSLTPVFPFLPVACRTRLRNPAAESWLTISLCSVIALRD